MDLKPLAHAPTEAERACIDAVVGALDAPATVSLRDADARRHLLLPALHAAQNRFGWIPPGALAYAAERLHVPPAEAFGVASFYALFSLRARGPVALHVCDDLACLAAGAESLCDALSHDPRAHRAPCLGLCDQAPAALLTVAGTSPRAVPLPHATAGALRDALTLEDAPATAPVALPQRASEGTRLLSRVGTVDPTSLDAYRAHGGYVALRRALELGPAWVMRELGDAGLSGRGGAAFPAARKWEAVARAPGPARHVVCNADESEPGTFKDRALMEGDPFALVEAMTLAGAAVGAEKGWIYLRAEYPVAAARLEHAIAACRRRGLLGDDVMGRGLRFDLELRRGAGAYICGEETALLESIEGRRGEPRTKPPFPVEHGLFGQPTLVHNVETLANVPWIVREGAAAFRAAGTAQSPGTRLFCVSGAVARPGVYERPFGVPLSALLHEAGADAGALRAVLLGGAAGVFVGPEDFDMPLTLEDARARGATLGSGVVFALHRDVDLGALLARLARFFREESCGQCVPCRVGTVRQHELVTRLRRRSPHGARDEELARFAELSQAMRDASICGLGQTASSAIESAITRLGAFQDDPPR